MSKAVYYKSTSPNVVDFVERIHSYKLYLLSQFCVEHSDQVKLYASGTADGETTITTVYLFPNDTDYESLLSDPNHPANFLPTFINDSVVKTFCERRGIQITYEIIDNWTPSEDLTLSTDLGVTPMFADELDIYLSMVDDIEAEMVKTNEWGRYVNA